MLVAFRRLTEADLDLERWYAPRSRRLTVSGSVEAAPDG